jgi:hypothetical protein
MFDKLFTPINNGTSYTLPDMIVDRREQVTDCTLSEKLCWGAVSYTIGESYEDLDKICIMLHKMQVASLVAEQAMARERLCSMEFVPIPCFVLSKQIQEIKSSDSIQDCAVVGSGPGDLALPVCEPRPTSGGAAFVCSTVSIWGAIAAVSHVFFLSFL